MAVPGGGMSPEEDSVSSIKKLDVSDKMELEGLCFRKTPGTEATTSSQ